MVTKKTRQMIRASYASLHDVTTMIKHVQESLLVRKKMTKIYLKTL
jgi:hypothetical protein